MIAAVSNASGEEVEDDSALSNRRECSRGRRLQRGGGAAASPKSWPILRWESALRSTLIRLERSCSACSRLSPLSFPPARASGFFLFPPASRAPHLLSFFPRLSLALPIHRQSANGTYQLDAHNQARKRRFPAIGSDRPPARSCSVLACGTEPPRLRFRPLDPAAWISM